MFFPKKKGKTFQCFFLLKFQNVQKHKGHSEGSEGSGIAEKTNNSNGTITLKRKRLMIKKVQAVP